MSKFDFMSKNERRTDRFETMRVTPRRVADAVVEHEGRFEALDMNGERFAPSQRFLKGLAQRMKVPLSVFDLFSPLEVITRAAKPSGSPTSEVRSLAQQGRKRVRSFCVDCGRRDFCPDPVLG